MEELQDQQRRGSKSYNETQFVPLRSNLPLKTLEYEEQRVGTNNQTNSDELFNFSQSQLVNEEMRGGMPAEQLYRSGYEQDSDMGYPRRTMDARNEDVNHDLKERPLPEEFDDEEEDDCLSRDAAGEESFKANLRLKNSEVNRLFNMHIPGYAPAAHAKYPAQAPFQLDESRIPASGSMMALQGGPGNLKGPLQQRQMNDQNRIYPQMQHAGIMDNSLHHNPVQPTFNTTKRPSHLQPMCEPLQDGNQSMPSAPPKAYGSQQRHLPPPKPDLPTSPSRPVQILITSNDNQQIARLNERCQQLEAHCRDLIKTNKLLDLENRLCISQILNINNASQGGPTQLNNFVGALQMLKKQNQVYGPR